MKKAIENAIYYSDTIPTYLENSVAEFFYDSQNIEELKSHYISSIDAKMSFGAENSACYNIIKSIPSCYDNLLLSQLNSILLVDKYDKSIRLINSDKYDDSDEINKIAIIRIDSVMCGIKKSWSKWLLLPGFVVLSLGGVYLGHNYYDYD